MSYTSLHNHTEFSNTRLLDCIIKPRELILKAFSLKMKGVAITDHESLSSFIDAENFIKEKRETERKINLANQTNDWRWRDFKLIRGNEIYLTRNGLTKENYVRGEDYFYHCILLAKDYEGYKQLCQISKKAWGNSFKHFMTRVPTYFRDIEEVIGDNKGHLIISTACLGGFVPHKLLEGKIDEVNNWLDWAEKWFGKDNLYLEMQPADMSEQRKVNQLLLRLSDERNIPYIITTDSHYINKEDRAIHKAYLSSKSGDREVDAFYEATYMMSEEEIFTRMGAYFDRDTIQRGLDTTNEIYFKIEDYSLFKPLEIPYLPLEMFNQELCADAVSVIEQIPLLEYFLDSEEPANQQFATRLINFMAKCQEDMQISRYKVEAKCSRLTEELENIKAASEKQNVAWSKYFLMVADYIEIYWTLGDSFVCPSRGSAGASYVSYGLGIIQIDPTREKAALLHERFINPDRASVLDIDIDISSNKRGQCIKALQEVYGVDRVTRVATYKTEKSKSAILTAARALNIPVDVGRYISSLIESERGIMRTLQQSYYGDEAEGLAPNKAFVAEMDKRPNLWKVAQRIEDLVCGNGSHAGGVVITEKPIEEYCGIMRTSSGDIVTCYDLHQCEEISLIKIDLLATAGLQKIQTTVELLCEYGFLERKPTLKETYESAIGVYNLDRTNPEMWEKVWNHEITSLFQMEKESGIQGIALTKPKSLEDLAILNSCIRLMPPDKKSERPLEKFARFVQDKNAWDREMREYGLNEHQRELLHSLLDYSNGIAAHQEDLYQLMRHPEIAGFSFGESDKLRKAVAKKNPKDYEAFEKKFWENAEAKNLDKKLCSYVWNVLVATQRGYGFNLAHTLSYSIVALQEMNLAHFYPIIFWNTANLIVDSGADYDTEYDSDEDEIIEDVILDEDLKENKASGVDYGKIASAIGRMQQEGIQVLRPDINLSKYTYTPNASRNEIRYGLKGISYINDNLIEEIIANRPYTSFEDFKDRVKTTKPQIVNLIKSGAFDSFGKRRDIMYDYIRTIADQKTTLNMRNLNMLLTRGLLPIDGKYDTSKQTFFFDKYLKKLGKTLDGNYYRVDEIALGYLQKNDLSDMVVTMSGVPVLGVTAWKKTYDSRVAIYRDYIKEHLNELLDAINKQLMDEVMEKYASGTESKWSMDSVSFYQDEHELAHVDLEKYGIERFCDLPVVPDIEYSFKTKEGTTVNIFRLTNIIGTVIDKDIAKSEIKLLTTDGVVTVKAFGVVSLYNKQVSVVGPDGKKKVVEKSMFTRGNKIMVHGHRIGETFMAKKYKKEANMHHFYLIEEVKENGELVLKERSVE